jgi:peptidoglycan/LPS O-acetylase OafA/YrhL
MMDSIPTTNNDDDDTNGNKPAKNTKQRQHSRLDCLDGLRGVLCGIVVVHHFRCGLDPCLVFGDSAEWILGEDPSVFCANTSPTPFLEPLANGTFAVAVFFVMSGVVLSHRFLWQANNHCKTKPKDPPPPQPFFYQSWRMAVVKRYFRLCLPCAAALLWAYALGGWTVHEEVAAITRSRWLWTLNMRRPSSWWGLVSQMVWGVWHGTCTLNNAIWTMKVELLGSFVVLGLVAVLHECSPTTRQRFLAAIFCGLAGSQ